MWRSHSFLASSIHSVEFFLSQPTGKCIFPIVKMKSWKVRWCGKGREEDENGLSLLARTGRVPDLASFQ